VATRAYADVAQLLLERLRTDDYPAGSRLPGERQLADELGVSRPTLREALAALELMGVVNTHVGAGTYVVDNGTPNPSAQLNSEDASPSDILQVRILIEPDIAKLAAANWDRQSLAAIARPLKQVERAAESGSSAHPTNEDRQFHAAIAKASGSDVLVSLLAPLWSMMAQSLWRSLKARGWDVDHTRGVAVDHREIYEAIRARDGELAQFLMEKHIRSVVKELFSEPT
jgi:DNA-binding FadR family transcriptional regulator